MAGGLRGGAALKGRHPGGIGAHSAAAAPPCQWLAGVGVSSFGLHSWRAGKLTADCWLRCNRRSFGLRGPGRLAFDKDLGLWQTAASIFPSSKATFMAAKQARGTKRTCQSDECGARFYDLNRSPIVCPICGSIYEIASGPVGVLFKDEEKAPRRAKKEAVVKDDEAVAEAGEEIADIESDDAAGEEADDTFLEEEEEDGGDMNNIVGGGRDGDEEP